MGKRVVRCLPQRTRFYFWMFYVSANVGENPLRNASVRVRVDGHMDRGKPVL